MATLRQIIEKMGEEWMDAEFTVRVYDGHLNSEYTTTDDSYHSWSRFGDSMSTDGVKQLRINVGISQHRLVKERSR